EFMSEWILTGICALILALVHFFAGKLTFIKMLPRSKWLSFGGGISVAYVFIHVLPELEVWQQHFRGDGFFKHHLYVFSLAGLVLFYGIERAAKLSRESERKRDGRSQESDGRTFYIHLATFAVYNILIGYLLVNRNETEPEELMYYVLAMVAHFIINDFGLQDHYGTRYKKTGRFVLSGSVIGGWVVGLATEIPPAGIGVIFGLVSGGVILNTLKEELPEERRSNFPAFLAGCLAYSVVLLLI
ncbi:MAG: hypothetical protein WBG62_13130, partial [Cyclobacteriaceae bacterium]